MSLFILVPASFLSVCCLIFLLNSPSFWLVATDGVEWSCPSWPWALQKWLNWSRCCLLCWCGWAEGTICYVGVQITHASGSVVSHYTESASAGCSMSAVQMPVGVYKMGCTLAQPGEYDWTVICSSNTALCQITSTSCCRYASRPGS